MKPLNFKTQNILIPIRSDQAKNLERIKYEGRIEKNMKIFKTEIIRAAIDSFFEMGDDAILELLSQRVSGLQ